MRMIEKSERPDFRCEFGGRPVGIEITTATRPEDEAAITRGQKRGGPTLVGAPGRRFPRGAGNPEHALWDDIFCAVMSKSNDIPTYETPLPEYVLLIYTSGDARLLIDDAMRITVLKKFQTMNWKIWPQVPVELKTIVIILEPTLFVLTPDILSHYRLVG